MSGSSSVAVVGGGASGTLAAVHLLREARARAMPLEVVLIDRYGRHALGQAYSTTDPHHLLNACANKMSGLDDDPGHFLRWALDDGLDVSASDYLPRRTYGRYLRDLLAGAEEWPVRVVRKVTGTVSALTRGRGVRVHLSGGGQVDAEAVVLALGNRAQAALPPIVDAASPSSPASSPTVWSGRTRCGSGWTPLPAVRSWTRRETRTTGSSRWAPCCAEACTRRRRSRRSAPRPRPSRHASWGRSPPAPACRPPRRAGTCEDGGSPGPAARAVSLPGGREPARSRLR
ncbi:FAD/NAD(P)-binding protein [Streptosporangium sp. LJ11]|uniref:FAD/NAD(P)-binding protein n=1 Tax=Streptosporangium sp. LJ11 TaxID=3436927 RepID=UPI003F79549A